MKVLVVEDNPELSQNIKSYLQQAGYVTELVSNLNNGMEKLYAYQYDVVVLDIMLPDGVGLDLLQTIKTKAPETGVLIISAKNSLNDKLAGLDMGADDYLPKPFHFAELNARLKAIYRRRSQNGQPVLEFKEIKLNPETFEASVNDRLLELTKKEFELLHYFIINQNRLLTKQGIAEHLWGDYVDMGDSFDFVYQHIKNIRKKVTQLGGGDYIRTIYGAGYKMTAQ
jgi:DNA-binding response OmpR family regulator